MLPVCLCPLLPFLCVSVYVGLCVCVCVLFPLLVFHSMFPQSIMFIHVPQPVMSLYSPLSRAPLPPLSSAFPPLLCPACLSDLHSIVFGFIVTVSYQLCSPCFNFPHYPPVYFSPLSPSVHCWIVC